MAELIQKAAPVIVVAAIFGWCCWPYLAESASGLATGESGIPGLPNSMLSPKVKAANDRDPFRSVDAAAAIKKLLAGTQETGGKTSGKSGKEGQNLPMPTKSWASLVFNGTYSQGDRRMAIIDGKVYSTGEALEGVGTARQPWVIKRILDEKVLVLCGNDLRTLSFTKLTSTPKETDGQDKPKSERKEATDSTKKQAPPSKEPSQGSSDGMTSLNDLLRIIQDAQKQQ